MTGILVINHFLRGKKYSQLHEHLVQSAKEMNINLKVKTNQEVLFNLRKPRFVLFWDKDVNLAKSLENRNIPVFNSSSAIALCDDKAKTYLALENKVKQPKTIIPPLSFYKTDYSDFVDMAIEKLSLPLIFKECFGSFGEQVYLCHSKSDILSHISEKPFILQKFIARSFGEDIRLEIVGGKCVAAMKRKNKFDFRANITNGGTAVPYTPSDKEVACAVKACDILGLTFAGVDLLKGNYVCEVNSNAHIINIMNCTQTDIAPFIFESILKSL